MSTQGELLKSGANGQEAHAGRDPFEWSADELAAMRELYAPKATDAQWKVFIMEAGRRKLMPGKQLFFRLQRQKEWDAELKQSVWIQKPIHITGIDAFRVIAQRTQKYAGQRPLVWIYLENSADIKKGSRPIFFELEVPCPLVEPYAARATVLRKDFSEPLSTVARMDAYVQTYKDKDSGKQIANQMWQRMGPEQLGKCAEALALRKAFPEDLWGLYITEEFTDEIPDSPEPSHGAGQVPPPVPALPPVSALPATVTGEAASSTPESGAGTPLEKTPAPSPSADSEKPPAPVDAPQAQSEPKALTAEDVQSKFGGVISRPASEAGKQGAKWFIRNVLDKQNVKQGGDLMKAYILRASGESKVEKISAEQWSTILQVLDGILRRDGPAGLVTFIQSRVEKRD